MAKLTKQQLLAKMKDPNMKQAVRDAVKSDSDKGKWIDKDELNFIVKKVALANITRTVNKKEKHDLKKIYRYKYLGSKAKKTLKKFFKKRRKQRGERVVDIYDFPHEIKEITTILKKASAFPPKGLRLPGSGLCYEARLYKAIATLVEDGEVEVIEYNYGGPGEVESIQKRGRRGYYNSSKNELHFRRRTNWESTVIHEATHTIQDYENVYVTLGHLEAAAHLIQAVYIIRTKGAGALHGRLKHEDIKSVALKLAQGKTGVVTKDEYTKIKKVLKEKGGYDVEEIRNKGNDKDSEYEAVLWMELLED